MKSYNIENQRLMRRVASLFIIVAMLLTSVFPVGASEDNIVSVSPISFDDGNGNTVESLDGLSKVRAEVTVKTKSSQKMVFILALYGKNNKLLKIDREFKRATSSGTTFEAAIEYSIPSNAKDYKLNAFLVDNVKDMNTIARASLFPGANLELANLFVTIDDNEPVDIAATQTAKDGVYKMDVPVNTKYAPGVKAVPVDGGTKVEVTPPTTFPGKSEVKLTASNGSTKTYVIEYVAKSSIESITGFHGKNFHAADDTTEDYGSQYFYDRSTPAIATNGAIAYYNDIRTISDEWDYLKGKDYYMAGVGDYTNPSYKSDRSTTVHVFGTGAITGTGWTSSTNAAGHLTISHTTGAGVEGHADYKSALAMTVVSSKTFPAGTVTLPAINKAFIVVVESAQYIPESHRAFSVASITANGQYVDTSEGPGTYDAPLSADTVYAPEITEDDIAFVSDYEDRTVEITNPTTFPGQSVIKITAGEETQEYVINYVADNLFTSASSNLGYNFHAADDANAVESAGYLRGSRFFMDRDDATLYYGNTPSKGVGYFNDIRSISSEYDFLNGSPYFMTSAGGALNTKFTVGRDADAYIFMMLDAAITGTEGWTKSTNSNGFLTISSSAGEGVPASACIEAKPLAAAKMVVSYHKKLAPGDSVDITPSTNKTIVVVKFRGYIEKGLTLTDLAVDGKPVAGFSADRHDYKVEIPANTLICPKVTATAENADTEVEIIEPTSFPGKATVRLTYEGKTRDYTITYTASDLISNASRAVGKNFHAAEGDDYGSQVFSDRGLPVTNATGLAYYNDIRGIDDEWAYLTGTDYFMSSVDANARPVTFTLNRSAIVRVFSDGTNAVPGWDKVTLDSGYYMAASTTTGQLTEAGSTKFNTMFYKKFSAGDTVTVSPTVMTAVTVIDYSGYMEASAVLSGIEVNGKAIEGFAMDKNDYTVEIDGDTLIAPEVTATALLDDADVEIIPPESFPGKTVIKVTYGDDVNVYTVSYTASDLISNASRAVGKNFHAADGDNLGSQLFSDRNSPAMAIGGGVAYYNDIRAIDSEWAYLTGTDYFMSAVGARNVTFTLNRSATVRVFSDGTNAVSGWDKVTLDGGYYMAASSTTGQFTAEESTKFNTMFYKKFSAGETVTVSPSVMTSVIVIDYAGYMEGASALLSGIEVNGEALNGFSMDKNDYTVEIAPDTLTAPEVTATALFEGTDVEIIPPVSFPGKTVIRVTYGDDENEYTITYTSSELISDASRAVGKDFHAADDANATEVNGAKIGSQLYNDRATPSYNSATGEFAYFNDIRAIDDEWDYLNGTDFFTSAVSSRSVTFTLNRSATVRVFSEGTAAVSTADGWTREAKESGYYMVASATSGHLTVDNSSKFTQMFYKKFSAGETVTVNPTVKESIIVIDYAGYVEAAAALLTGIEVNGEALQGFSPDKTEYTMEIDPDTVEIPVVTATAFADGSEIEVIDPESFPGKTIVRVSLDGDEKEYTITYTVADLVASSSRAVGKDFHAADDANATQSGGYMVGSPIFSDRGSPVTNAAGLAYFNDVRSISDEWDYLNGTDFFTTSVAAGGRPVTFTLNRRATIRVFALETNALNTADGWTKESKSDGFMKVSFTSGHIDESSCGQFGYMFYKELSAGEEITVSPSTRDFLVVIDYAGYGEVEEVPAGYAALTDITIDGVTIDGFDKEITDYAYEIAPDALVIPEITATAVNSDSEVEIINPGMGDNPNVFPGKTIIIVRSGSDEREYVIDYTYTGLSAITDMSSSNGGSFFAVNFHEPGDVGETYGSRLFYDRTAVPAYSGSTLAYYNDVREICDEMDYLKGTDYIMANRNLGANVTHTFTLLRPATIRVFHLTGYAAGNATLADWTTVVNDTAYIRTSHTTGSGVEGHAQYRETLGYGSMTYKEFDAGDEVSIASPGDHAIVVIEYAGYEVQ